jgi:hypothetical protein
MEYLFFIEKLGSLLTQLSFFFMGFLVLCGGHFVLEEQYRKISRLIKRFFNQIYGFSPFPY